MAFKIGVDQLFSHPLIPMPSRSATPNPTPFPGRRRLLRYLVGSGMSAVAVGWLHSAPGFGRELDLETLCSAYPENSRCRDYLPGVQALNLEGQPIVVNQLLPTVTPGEPVPVKGLPETERTYLVIHDGPEIASYGIQPICTHLGCTVDWNDQQSRFICPCHGSQYDAEGRVLQGPAQRSLPLITVVVKKNQVRLVDRAPSIDPR